MVSYENMCGGCMPFRIAVGTLLVFLAPGCASDLSNDGGGSWQYSRESMIRSQGAAPSVDDRSAGTLTNDLPYNAQTSDVIMKSNFEYW